jgi:hypothetical protein
MSLSERQRETYEKILLAKTMPEKTKIVEDDLTGEDQKKLKFWFKLAQGQAKKDWPQADKKEFEEWYGGSKNNLENIDLLLRYELADTEPKRKEILKEIAIKLNLNPSNESKWNYNKPFNHEYAK